MALKVFKFECIWYLFGALEVEKKRKEKNMGRPVKAHEAQNIGMT
jgi:hypothetical protein